ncbi:MAG: hypothetical protein ACOYCD_04000 [Kiritimatiellia bacterium]
MVTKRHNIRLISACAAALLLLVAGLAGGCATSGDQSGSSMPWNTPQGWEGAPALPVFTE